MNNDNGGNGNTADTVGSKAVYPNQLRKLLHFDGNRGESLVIWIECLETARLTLQMDSLVQVAKAKGGSTVAKLDRGNRLRGININLWEGDDGFRARLFKRFGPKYASATAVNTVSNLKQKPRKSCAQFLDCVILAVNKQNFNIPEAEKATAVYWTIPSFYLLEPVSEKASPKSFWRLLMLLTLSTTCFFFFFFFF